MSSSPATCIVIDDELGSRKNINLLIEEFTPHLRVLGSAASADEARSLLKKHSPDIIFLDVQMPGEDGFEFLDSLKNRDFALIFVTAFEKYALRAIKASAIDYLLKPVDVKELAEAVEKGLALRESENAKGKEVYADSIENFLSDIESQDFPEKLTLPNVGSFIMREVQNICYLDASSNYTNFNFIDGEHIVVSKTLKYYEELLNPLQFLRVNRSVIINLECLETFSLETGDVFLLGGKSFSISRRRRKDIDLKIRTFRKRTK